VKLLERAGTGVRPTVQGMRLLELIRPLVAGLDSTREVLQQEDGAFPRQLVLVTNLRVLVEEISLAMRAFQRRRSLAPVSGMENGPSASARAGLPIEHKGVEDTVEHKGGRVLHKAARRDADGNLFAEIEAEVRFALGSGTRGISFLIERDGFLFQSPIAWFAQNQHWDISPGYGEFSTRPDFERAIQPDCLFCHSNRFHPWPEHSTATKSQSSMATPSGVSAATAQASCT
jgi:hypothetical protein